MFSQKLANQESFELLHDRINIKGIRPITEKEYYVGGSTALLDAIGKTIHKIGNVQRHTSKDQRADKVVLVITTDGMENASREYTPAAIKKLVERQKEKYGWEIIFLGANIDAISAAERVGISADRAAKYHADGEGTRLNYEVVSHVVSEIRANRLVADSWKAEIDEDFARRNKNR